MISIGATGNIVKGSVLDVNKKALEEKLRDYDKQLYIAWNPKKLKGMGTWEIRRRPEQKSAVPKTEYMGQVWFVLEYVENNLINHVLDVPVLNYDVLGKIARMDTINVKNWAAELDYKRMKYEEKIKKEEREELSALFRDNKREMRDFKELVASGFNPARISKYWK